MASSCNCPITLKERKKEQTNKQTKTKPFAQFSLFYNLDAV